MNDDSGSWDNTDICHGNYREIFSGDKEDDNTTCVD